MSTTSSIKVPQGGKKIVPGQPVPDQPIIPFIEGDGIGIDITPVMRRWWTPRCGKPTAAPGRFTGWRSSPGRSPRQVYGRDVWLSEETLATLKEFSVSIKGPIDDACAAAVSGRSTWRCARNSTSTVCLRPVRYIKGVPSPLKRPGLADMVIFRENTEDIYAGIEWAEDTTGRKR